jgi:hypothetical protein
MYNHTNAHRGCNVQVTLRTGEGRRVKVERGAEGLSLGSMQRAF